jgi:hypothetical protein
VIRSFFKGATPTVTPTAILTRNPRHRKVRCARTDNDNICPERGIHRGGVTLIPMHIMQLSSIQTRVQNFS